MSRFLPPLILAAGPVLAHGGHAPVPSMWHGLVHSAWPILAIVVAGVAIGIARQRALRQQGGRTKDRG